MSRRLVRALPTLSTALLAFPLSACGFVYSAGSIEGWVVDAETEKPISDMVVVAHWQLKGGFEGGTPVNEVKILESLTDQNGRYFFPAWGPRFALMGDLSSDAPVILMFKRGYKFLGLGNYNRQDGIVSRSEWNEKTVKLGRFNGTLAQYAQHLSGLNSDLWTIGYDVGRHWGDPCGWKSFPNMLRALDPLDREIEPLRLGYRTVAGMLRDNDSKLHSAGCGTVTDLFGK
jgi:hypothetical protein